MIQFKCKVDTFLPLDALMPLQGQLKKRTSKDIEKLAQSIREDGLIMPFVVWNNGETNYLLDGHARLSAIYHLAKYDGEILQQSFPVLYGEPENIDEAKLHLLHISSSYGKITPKGLQEFIKSSPKIHVEKIGIKVKPLAIKLPPFSAPTIAKNPIGKAVLQEDEVLIKLRVKKHLVDQVTKVLSQFNFVDIV